MSQDTEQAEYISNAEYISADGKVTRPTLLNSSLTAPALSHLTLEVTLVGHSQQIRDWIQLVAKGEPLDESAKSVGILLRIEQAEKGTP